MSIINSIICADVIAGLKQIPNDTVTLTINSPPYNLAASEWSYATATDDQPYLDYVNWLADVYRDVYRVTRTGGRLIINIDAMTNRQDDREQEYIRDIRTDLANVLKPIGWKFFGEHVWCKTGGTSVEGSQFCGKKTAWGSYCMPSHPAVRRNHEYILVYSKDQFKLEKSADSGEPDMTPKEFQTWIASLWLIQPENRNLGNHPVPFPQELPDRCCKLYSYPNDIILDPFSGVGTTALSAKVLKRRYIGIDMDEGYCKYARERIMVDRNILE